MLSNRKCQTYSLTVSHRDHRSRRIPYIINQEAEIMKDRKFTITVGSAYIAVLALFVLFANMF